MGCELNQYGKYDITSVTHDRATNKYVVKLKEPTAKCPEGVFVSRNLVLKKGADHDFLAYSTQVHAPVLALKNTTAITEIADPITMPVKAQSSGIGFFGWLLIIALIAGGVYLIRKLLASANSNDDEPSPEPTYRTRPAERSTFTPAPTQSQATSTTTPPPAASSPQQVNQQPQTVVHEHHTTVVNQQSGVDPLLAGVIGYELGQGNRMEPRYVEPPYGGNRIADEMRENRLYEKERDLDRERHELEAERANVRQAALDTRSDDDSFEDDSDDEDTKKTSNDSSFKSDDDDSFSDDSSGSSFSDDSSSSFSDDSSSSSDSFSSDDN